MKVVIDQSSSAKLMSIPPYSARDDDERVSARDCTPAQLGPDVRSLATVGHQLDIGSSVISIAVVALRASLECLANIKTSLAAGPKDVGSITETVATNQLQLRHISLSASFNGVNLLCSGGPQDAKSDRINVVSAVARDLHGVLTIKSIEVDRLSTAMIDLAEGSQAPRGILDRVDPGTGLSLLTINLSILELAPVAEASRARIRRQVDAGITAVHRAIRQLSIVQSRINLQSSFIASLAEASAAESAALVDANFSEDMTKQTALHTVRLLHAHSLSIASLNRQTVLKLFKDD